MKIDWLVLGIFFDLSMKTLIYLSHWKQLYITMVMDQVVIKWGQFIETQERIQSVFTPRERVKHLIIILKICKQIPNHYSGLEDASNIMRVISLKNYCESTRVVIQLLQYQNKVMVNHW